MFHGANNITTSLPVDSNVLINHEITDLTDEDKLLLDEFTDDIPSEESSENEDESDEKNIDTKVIFLLIKPKNYQI